jgi:hypothetical protein
MKEWLICKVCNKEHETWDALTSHIKAHKIAQKKYFEQHWPKHDIYSAQPILFKSLEQYVLADFADKRNLKSWLKKVGTFAASAYLSKKLKTYCSMKKHTSAPSQSILKSINTLPSIEAFDSTSGKFFNEFCESISLPCRFDYSLKPVFEKIGQIVVDTRERAPIKFNAGTRIVNMKLDYADYALSPASKVAVERKSVSDFFGTLGAAGYERFTREIERAKMNKGYIVIVVEASFNNVAFGKWRWGRANPEFILHRMRELYKTYDCIQFLFCDGRGEVKRLIPIILGMKDGVRKIDLQYNLDKKLI